MVRERVRVAGEQLRGRKTLLALILLLSGAATPTSAKLLGLGTDTGPWGLQVTIMNEMFTTINSTAASLVSRAHASCFSIRVHHRR